ncbi:MAG: DUF72 domain-containing protein [candidate division KSB1 bacterium]|nr:DUF72 domain-containing protein [candidate division KSB1 bacterium]
MSTKKIYIGTSGWNYKHWRGTFYPENMPQKKWLEYYMQRFRTVELNNSFYQLPRQQTLETWRDTVPEDFHFAVKASRYITHMKKLKDPKDAVRTFFQRIESLGEKSSVILFQLPPKWKFNKERLQSFLQTLPTAYRYTFEFRDPSWWNEQTYEILTQYNAAFCQYELAGTTTPYQVTADFVYIRLHGPGDAYEGSYDQTTLEQWCERFLTWTQKGYDVYCYFDNDQNGYAAKNALTLQSILA